MALVVGFLVTPYRIVNFEFQLYPFPHFVGEYALMAMMGVNVWTAISVIGARYCYGSLFPW